MNQDTRKDRRVKIVSLNVRYKSATVDEFIENHAHDVSRGGIYIKTANPFPPGTLLKFEIRLASDQAVIAGVGRVVWKRDAGTSNGERPAGMGVKFIKIDEPSKTVIDKLVNTKADAGKSYESEAEMPTGALDVPSAKLIPPAPTTKLTPPAGTGGPLPPRKATMMGLGIPTGSSPPPAEQAKAKAPEPTPAPAPAAPRPATSGGMFPSTHSVEDMPPKQEQTVMKQAAELLEEALREAGGSMDEIGHNPLFSGSGTPGPAPAAAKESAPPPSSDRETSPAPEVKGPSVTDKKKTSMPPVEVKTPAVEVVSSAKAKDADDAAKARAMVAGMSPGPRKSQSEPPRTSRESPSAKASPAVGAREPAAKKGGGGGAFILLFVVVAAAAGAVVMYRDRLFGPGDTPVTTPSTTATAETPTAPATTSAAATTTAASPSAAPSASAAASASASAAPSASAATAPSATATAPPTATAVPTATATATAATATATATAAPRPTATATATAAETATATAAPKPKPKPKPADDNPY